MDSGYIRARFGARLLPRASDGPELRSVAPKTELQNVYLLLKMLMSGVSKGITALFLEMGRAASEAQMLDEFWDSVVQFYPGFTSAVERMLPTVPRHARRRAGEMGELADTLANLSLPPGLMLEFQRLYADVGRAVSPETVAASSELCIRELLDQLASEMRLASREHDEQLNQLVLPTTHGN